MTPRAPVQLTRHADVVAAACDPVTFSSHTSTHLHVPNGMDGDEHRAFRALVESYMTPDAVAALAPRLADISRRVVRELPRGARVDVVAELGEPFAVRAQCDWLGWPADFEPRLREWMAENYAAAAAHDPERNTVIAAQFGELVREAILRAEPGSVTSRLAHDSVNGQQLTMEQTVSILRNWTAGDLGSIARCVGVIVRRLADSPALQARARALSGRDDHDELDAILLECLRLEDPFVANRRRATCPAALPSGARMETDDIVMLDWVAANRDPQVFADRFDAAAHREHNLVFGIGPHVCPGFALSMAELRSVTVALLRATSTVEPAKGESPTPYEPPIGGWRVVPVVLR